LSKVTRCSWCFYLLYLIARMNHDLKLRNAWILTHKKIKVRRTYITMLVIRCFLVFLWERKVIILGRFAWLILRCLAWLKLMCRLWIFVEVSSTLRYLAFIILRRFDCLRLRCLAWIVVEVSSPSMCLAWLRLRRFAWLRLRSLAWIVVEYYSRVQPYSLAL